MDAAERARDAERIAGVRVSFGMLRLAFVSFCPLLLALVACHGYAPTSSAIEPTAAVTATPRPVPTPASPALATALAGMEGRWQCDEPHSQDLVITRMPDASYDGTPVPQFEFAFGHEMAGTTLVWRQQVTLTPAGCMVSGDSSAVGLSGSSCDVAGTRVTLSVLAHSKLSPAVEGHTRPAPRPQIQTFELVDPATLVTLVPVVDAGNGARCTRVGA